MFMHMQCILNDKILSACSFFTCKHIFFSSSAKCILVFICFLCFFLQSERYTNNFLLLPIKSQPIEILYLKYGVEIVLVIFLLINLKITIDHLLCLGRIKVLDGNIFLVHVS